MTVNTQSIAGIIFDYESPLNFKFAGIIAGSNKAVIGHRTAAGWQFDESVNRTITAGVDYQLGVSIHDSMVSVSIGGVKVASHTYRGFVDDGNVGLFTWKGGSSFDNVSMKATTNV